MPSIFSRIIAREIPGYIIAEDERFIAFLDRSPQVEGHTLVVPKQEIDRLWDLPDHLLHSMLTFAKPIALALEAAIACKRCAISVIGLEVPHAHMHLLPIQHAGQMNPGIDRLKFSEEEYAAIHSRILAHL